MKPWLLEFHGNPYLAPHHANREDEATIQARLWFWRVLRMHMVPCVL